MDDSNQAAQLTLWIEDCVIENSAMKRVVCEQPVFVRASDEVVANDAAGAVNRHIRWQRRIPQTNSRIAVDGDIALYDAILRLVPEEHRAAGFARPPVDSDEYVVTDRPSARVHHVDSADVITAEVIHI